MSKIRELKREIERTQMDLEENVEMLENELNEVSEIAKEVIEQGVLTVRNAFHAVSPVEQIKKHPGVAQGVCFGLGVCLAMSAPRISRQSSSLVRSAKDRGMLGGATRGFLEPVALGIVATVASKVLKARLPQFEHKVDAVHGAIIAEMSQRFLRQINAT